MSVSASPTIDFLIAAAREFREGGWVFTGFHWPVLAGHLAYALDGEPFWQVLEPGAILDRRPQKVPTSTTDYASYATSICCITDTASVLLGMGRRFDRVVLDAANVDLQGRINSSFIGSREHPRVRLAGGGGGPDIAWSARHLVLLQGGQDLRRIQRRVEHVTSAPGPETTVRLVTRWGSVRLGADPKLLELTDLPGAENFKHHLEDLGVDTLGYDHRRPPADWERREAEEVLREAAQRGYRVAERALLEETTVDDIVRERQDRQD